MWIYELRDKLWNIVRWDVQHNAHWSSCSSQVLFGVAQKCAEGTRLLGYTVSEPPPNRDAAFYKTWITDLTNETLKVLERYHFHDGSITKAIPVFEDAARRVRECSPNLAALESDEPMIQRAEA